MARIKRKHNKKKIIFISLSSILLLSLLSVGGYFYYDKILLDKISPINLKLNGEKNIIIEYGESYVDEGAKASFRGKDITKSITVNNNINYDKLGDYKITYIASVKNKSKKIERNIKIVDTKSPTIELIGDKTIKVNVDNDYVEPGFKATDNYDGDITNMVETTNNIDKTKVGTYEVIYKVSDQSGNTFDTKRVVNYINPFKELPSLNASASKIAVLNYHFFYDPTKGDSSGDSNYMSVQTFEEELKYLKENNYKTLTMDEFRRWMYGEIDLPARSVLLTIDDGGRGTGFNNGNRLIPLLEKYQAYATIFIITSWWSKSNYASNYVDVESHSDALHQEKYCEGVTRGAKILCLSDEEVLNDLKASIIATGSNNAFCYPFYVYNNHIIELVKEAGFKLGFVGGDYKATRSSNKYAIPRYHVYKNTSLAQFNNMIA